MKEYINKHITSLIPTVLVGFFLFHSFVYIKLTSSLKSLRFISDDLVEVIDSAPYKEKDSDKFYQSSKVLVIDIEKYDVTEASEILKNSNFFKSPKAVQITFSKNTVKNEFFKIFAKSTDSSNLSNDLKDIILTKSTSLVSEGKLCHYKDCIVNFIALKILSSNNKHEIEEIKKWN